MKSFWLLLLDCNFVVSHTKQEKRHLHVYVGTRSCQGQPLQCPYMYMCLCIEVCFVFMVSSGRQILFAFRMYFIETNQKGCQPFIILTFSFSKNMTLQMFNFKKIVFHGIWSVQWSYLIAWDFVGRWVYCSWTLSNDWLWFSSLKLSFGYVFAASKYKGQLSNCKLKCPLESCNLQCYLFWLQLPLINVLSFICY